MSTSTSTSAPPEAADVPPAFGICLGGQIYPLVARVRKNSSAPAPA
jgi:hypothetical protein